jgi:hypothetical protein
MINELVMPLTMNQKAPRILLSREVVKLYRGIVYFAICKVQWGKHSLKRGGIAQKVTVHHEKRPCDRKISRN